MTTDEIEALEPGARRRLERFRDCFKKSPVFEYFVYYSLGLMAQFERKSIEPIALWIGVAVRTLQLFLSQFVWDHGRIESRLRHMVIDEYSCDDAIGIIDGSGHAKQGEKTPGVQRQWCGETGKIDNCVVGQHLIYTNNDSQNPFTACVASDIYLPQCWIDDDARREEAHIPEDAMFRAKWEIAADQVDACIGMYILMDETTQLREKNPAITFEQVARTTGRMLQRSLESDPVFLQLLATINQYHQHRNRLSYESRRRRARIQATPAGNT